MLATLRLDRGCLFTALALSLPATAMTEDARPVLEDIVVTARRVEERAQTTPVAVTALPAAALEQMQVDNVLDLPRAAPNLSVVGKGQGGTSFGWVSIRGQTNSQQTLANDTAIGAYVDGVYIGHSAAQLAGIFDVQRLEVLRGPQGTLFGRNTTGGAINVVSNPPTGELGGSVNVGAGDYGLWKVGAVLNVPIRGDALAVRLAGQHSERDGHQHNDWLGRDEGDRKDDTARVSLRLAPEEARWDALVNVNYTKFRDNGSGAALLAFNPGSNLERFVNGVGPFAALGPQPPVGRSLDEFLLTKDDWYTTHGELDAFDRFKTHGVAATVNVDLGAVTLKSISGYQTFDMHTLVDLDGTPYPGFRSEVFEDAEQFSEELQVAGDAGPLTYVAGLYYFTEDGKDVSFANALSPAVAQRGRAEAKNSSYAVYGQANYNLTDRIRLTGGLRYTWDEREEVVQNVRNSTVPPTAPGNCNNGFPAAQNDPPNDPTVLCRLTLKEDFEYLSYLASIDFQASDTLLLYAKTSRAFLAGGWNFRAGAPALSFDPEEVKDVELGVKADWLDGRLRTNVALFYAWQDDVQRRAAQFFGSTVATWTINAASGTAYGAELEVIAVPWQGMEITASLGLTEAQYDEFTEIADSDPVAAGVQPFTLDKSDEQFPGVPDTTYAIGATQRLPTSYGEWTLHLDYTYMSSMRFFETTVNPFAPAAAQQAAATQRRLAQSDSYGLLNGRAGLSFEAGGSQLELALWGRNLADKKYIVRTFADVYTSFGHAMGWPGEPRTWGADLTYKF